MDILQELVDSYLLKDVLALDRIKGPGVLLNLLKLIAFQIGSQVSLSEIASQIKIDVKTVARYLDLFEKAFVIKRIGGFSRNLRKEVVSKAKYYFIDNGIRNAVISQFNPLDSRNDIGQLWENFIVTERLKKFACQGLHGNFYYWRTYDGQEIDLVEERDGRLYGVEIKWSARKKGKYPKEWHSTYSNSSLQTVNSGNYLDYIT